MANVNRPTGLSPVKMVTGAPYNGQCNVYAILAADANAFAIGDPVVSSASGADAAGVAAVTLAAATGAIRGVIVGIGTKANLIANPDQLGSTIRSAGAKTTDWYALVVDDPNIIFEVQEVGTGTPLTAADIGLNTSLLVGANNGFVSGWLLDNGVELGTATLQVKLLGLSQRVDNAFGAYAKHLVLINNHELRAGTAGV